MLRIRAVLIFAVALSPLLLVVAPNWEEETIPPLTVTRVQAGPAVPVTLSPPTTPTTLPPTTTTAPPVASTSARPALQSHPSRSAVRTTLPPTTTSTEPPPVTEPSVEEVPTTEPAPEVAWNEAQASWYGPGLYGNGTACGQKMTPDLVGVAHKSLPCGSRVTFESHGIVVETVVIDRGPYVSGRMWDLSEALCRKLNHCYTGKINYRIG